MPVDAYIRREGPHLGGALWGRYVRALLYYLLAVLVLWLVGIEGIYQHPTPFYGLISPAFSSFYVPAFALLAFGLLALATRFVLLPYSPRSSGRTIAAYGAWVAGLLITGSFLARSAFIQGVSPLTIAARQWPALQWHLFALAVFAGFFALWWWLILNARWFVEPLPPRVLKRFLFGVFLFSFCFSGAIAMLRNGTTGIDQAYQREALEYVGDIGKGLSIRGLFHDYVKMHEHLSIHAKVHPPGPIALLWLMSYVVGRDALALSLATMAFGATAVFPLFLWVRDMFNARTAATTVILYALMPSIVLFTATSADILFLPFVIFTLYFFWRAIHRPSIGYAVAAGVGYAFMSLMSFSLLAIGAFFGFVGLWRMWKGQWRSVFITAAVMLAAFLAIHGAVRFWSGFDIIEVFHLSKAQFDEDQFALELGAPRFPSWLWKLVNPMAWFYYAGIPVSVLLVWRLLRPEPNSKAIIVIFALTLVVLDILYLARGEGERSAMYILPFMVVPAAHLLDEIGHTARSYKPMIATFVFLALQCWLTESILYTYW